MNCFARCYREDCSPLWAGARSSHLSQLHAVETKAFRSIGISRDEAESLGLSLSHRTQVGGLSVFPCFVCALFPQYFPRALKVCQQPPSGETAKIKNQCSPSLFHSSFSPTFEINSHTLFNPILPSRSSKQLFTTISYLPLSKNDLFYPC